MRVEMPNYSVITKDKLGEFTHICAVAIDKIKKRNEYFQTEYRKELIEILNAAHNASCWTRWLKRPLNPYNEQNIMKYIAEWKGPFDGIHPYYYVSRGTCLLSELYNIIVNYETGVVTELVLKNEFLDNVTWWYKYDLSKMDFKKEFHGKK